MSKQNYLMEVSWKEARDDIAKACPDVAKLIDEIDPPKNFRLIKALYNFGEKIVDNGLLNLPTERGDILPITDNRIPAFARTTLTYSPVPLGILTKNKTEVYRELDERIFSIAYYGAGFEIGIWEYFGWTTPYSLTAGARSLYMLPSITLTSAHKRLKRTYGVTLPPPRRTSDHWLIFKQIASSASFSKPWFCEVYYFTDSWVEKIKKDKAWSKLQNYLIEKGWQHSAYGRRRSIFDIVWELFARTLSIKGLKPNPYVLDTLKHLIFVGTGGSPASAPANGDNEAGPIDHIQNVYINDYSLQEYIPTIMQPHYFSLDGSNPVYYSLKSPSLLESVPKSRNLTSIVDNVRELKELTTHFLGEAFDDHLKIANVSINDMISHLKFEFFHSESYAYGEGIRPTKEMPDKDQRLLYMSGNLKGRKFADSGLFLHGCVRISANKQKK